MMWWEVALLLLEGALWLCVKFLEVAIFLIPQILRLYVQFLEYAVAAFFEDDFLE